MPRIVTKRILPADLDRISTRERTSQYSFLEQMPIGEMRTLVFKSTGLKGQRKERCALNTACFKQKKYSEEQGKLNYTFTTTTLLTDRKRPAITVIKLPAGMKWNWRRFAEATQEEQEDVLRELREAGREMS